MAKVTDEMYQKASGQADEMIAEKSGKRTGPQMNIGPNMGREDVASKKSSAIDAYKKGADKAKAASYAKGGKVSSASSRADGCAIKGKTKGRMV